MACPWRDLVNTKCTDTTVAAAYDMVVGVSDTVVLADARCVVISGSTAFVTSGTGDSFNSYDISDPTNIILLDSITSANLDNPQKFCISGNYAYIACFDTDMLVIVDITTPSAMIEKGNVTSANLNEAADVTIFGSSAFVGCGFSGGNNKLVSIDVSNVNSPVELDSLSSVNINVVRSVDIDTTGNYVYLTSPIASKIVIFNVSVPATLTEESTISTMFSSKPYDVKQNGDSIVVCGSGYATGFSHGVQTVDVTSHASPAILDTINDAKYSQANGVIINGNLAYMVGGVNNFVSIIDITDVNTILETDYFTNASLADSYDVDISGNHLFIARQGGAGGIVSVELGVSP